MKHHQEGGSLYTVKIAGNPHRKGELGLEYADFIYLSHFGVYSKSLA